LHKYPGLNLKKILSLQKSSNPFGDISAYKEIKREIINFSPDIVHTHGAKSGFIGRYAAYKNKVPIIIHTYHGHHFHSYYNKSMSSLLSKLERKLAQKTTLIIAISKWQKKELTEIYRIILPAKVATIPLGIENVYNKTDALIQRNAFRKKYQVREDTITIGIAGRIVPVKNLKLFVQVAEILLRSASKKLRFFIIGDGVLKKQLKEQCVNLNLSYTEETDENASLIFTSWIEDIMPVMYAMDIVALTSVNEGTPLSLIEAQICGKPIVATNVGGVRDTLINGETGFLIEPNNPHAMAEKLNLLIENDELRAAMGKKAMTFAAANFSRQTEVENYSQLYASLLSQEKIVCSANQNILIE